MSGEMTNNISYFSDDFWAFNKYDRSIEVRCFGNRLETVQFHPNWSHGTAAIRGTKVLNNSRFYWELRVSRLFGTSLMFGVATKKARLYTNNYKNLIGEDENSWGLSHKGLLWHNGQSLYYTKPFEDTPTTVGVLFDGIEGTITFYKNGKCLGIAFEGLQLIKNSLYPIVSSTMARNVMTLVNMKKDFGILQDRCTAVILKECDVESVDFKSILIPPRIKCYLLEKKKKSKK